MARMLWRGCWLIAVLGMSALAEPRVLFIGNSYSFAAPTTAKQLAAVAGHPIHVEQVACGGLTLSRHAEGAGMAMAKKRWDVLVLQEQSQIPALPIDEVRARSVPAARALADAARNGGARIVLYQTWGRRDGDREHRPGDTFAAMQDRLAAGYELLARETGATVAPVGEAWRLCRERHPDLDLYQKDGSHPSAAGVYLAACVLAAAVGGGSPSEFPDAQNLDPASARSLRAAAEEAIAASRKKTAP